MKTIFTGLAPTTEFDDMMLACRLLLTPWQWKQGAKVNKFGELISDWLPAKHAIFFESGRTCLYAILQSLDLQPSDEVLVQAYTCVAVPDPIIWAGAKPIYVDCDQRLFTMSPSDLERKITAKSKVLIVQHTFGQSADLKNLLAIAKKHNLFVIEDCAHALGCTYDDRHLGTFGDASFFSFGRDKVISSVFGGTITTNNDELAQKLRLIQEQYDYPSSGWIVQQLLHPIFLYWVCKMYDYQIGKMLLYLIRSLRILSKAVYSNEKIGKKPSFTSKKFSNALAALALHQFAKLNRSIYHRQETAQIYNRELADTLVQIPDVQEGARHIFLRYTILTKSQNEILAKAKQESIFLGDWYTNAIAPQGVDYQSIHYDPTTCPNAEALARQSFNLPTDVHITERDALRIIEVVKRHL